MRKSNVLGQWKQSLRAEYKLSHEFKSLFQLFGAQATEPMVARNELFGVAETLCSKDTVRMVAAASPVLIAASIALMPNHSAYAAPGDVNSVNNGRDIQSGVYYNTPGDKTTFQNTNPSGLWLHAGDTVRGLESNPAGVPNGNGGALYFRAPGAVVRLDGNIDVSAIKNGAAYLGNGGKVMVDSAYLYQSGQIYANGVNGGLVQFNVGAATMTETAKIQAQGFGGAGGKVSINASGVVELAPGAVIDTSGKVIGTYDTNIINIEGGIVNNKGILRANGVASGDTKASDVVILQANPQLAEQTPVTYTSTGADNGGLVRIVTTNQSAQDCADCAITNVDNPLRTPLEQTSTFTKQEKAELFSRYEYLKQNANGDIINDGTIQANGADAANHPCPTPGGEGGTVILSAAHDVINTSVAKIEANGGAGNTTSNTANGGNGGTVVITALNNVNNAGQIEANGGAGGNIQGYYAWNANNGVLQWVENGSDEYSPIRPEAMSIAYVSTPAGNGGNGGLVAISYKTMDASGSIQANGGQGGNGGEAVAYDTNTVSGVNTDAFAKAEAFGGAGGNGGQGGLVVFSGPQNPTGSGSVEANGGQGGNGGFASATAYANAQTGDAQAIVYARGGAAGQGGQAGTLVAPSPATFADSQSVSNKDGGAGNSGAAQTQSTQISFGTETSQSDATPGVSGTATQGDNDPILQTQANELLKNRENAILLSLATEEAPLESSLTDRVNHATVRTVTNPTGSASTGVSELDGATNVVFASTGAQSPVTLDLATTSYQTALFGLNTVTISAQGDVTNADTWSPGVHVTGPSMHDVHMTFGGGHFSLLSTGNVTNDGNILVRGTGSGGSINVLAQGDFDNNGIMMAIPVNLSLLSGYAGSAPATTDHGGSIIIKAGHNLVNDGFINSNEAFYVIHPVDPNSTWPTFLNNAQIGATIQLFAGNDVINNHKIGANAYQMGMPCDLPPVTIGGVILAKAGHNVLNLGQITANGRSYVQTKQGMVDTVGQGGYIHLAGGNAVANGLPCATCAVVQANGSNQGGMVILTAANNPDGGLGGGIVDGVSFTNGMTPDSGTYSNGIDTSTGEAVYNFGTIEAISVDPEGTTGDIILAGDQLVARGAESVERGNLFMAANQGIVDLLFCPPPPPCHDCPPPENPPGTPEGPNPPQLVFDQPAVLDSLRTFTDPALVSYEGMMPTLPSVFLAQQENDTPETEIRKRLERETAKPRLRPLRRPTTVRGFW